MWASGVAGGAEFDEVREVLRRLARTDRNFAAAAMDWTGLIERRLASGRQLPPPLAGLVTDADPATLDPLAREVYSRAVAAGEQAIPQPLLGAAARLPGPARSQPVRQAVIVAAAAPLPIAIMVWLAVRSLGPPESDLPSTVSELSVACEGTVFPDAPAYVEGTPPHPTVVFAADYNRRLAGTWTQPQVILDEKNNALFSNAWKSNNTDQVQAVACLDLDESQQNAIDTCDYSNPRRVGLAQPPVQLPMYRGEFTLTLYETQTGRKVHQTHISGEVTQCPETLPVTASSVYTQPSAKQYADAIGRYIDG